MAIGVKAGLTIGVTLTSSNPKASGLFRKKNSRLALALEAVATNSIFVQVNLGMFVSTKSGAPFQLTSNSFGLPPTGLFSQNEIRQGLPGVVGKSCPNVARSVGSPKMAANA